MKILINHFYNMTLREIQYYDNHNMYNVLKNFPQQIGEAYEIGESLNPPEEFKGVSNIIICGLGGSAIGGDLLRSYLVDIVLPVQILIEPPPKYDHNSHQKRNQ